MIRTILIALAIAFLVSGCASTMQVSQPLLDPDKVNRIQRGKTTRAEVEALIGPPAHVAMMGSTGERMAVYSSYNANVVGRGGLFMTGHGAGTTRHQMLQIQYTADGIVRDFEFTDKTDNVNSRISPGGVRTETTPAR